MNAPNPEMNRRSRANQSHRSSSLDAEFGPEEYFIVELRLHEVHSSSIECDFAVEEGMEVPVSMVQPASIHGFPLKEPSPLWKNLQSDVNLLYSKERSRLPNG
jgi:hypothetical protein